MKRSHKTREILIAITLLVLSAITLYLFLFLRIAQEGRAISILENDIDFITEKEKKLRSTQTVLRETEDDRARLDDYFVAEDGIVSFIESVEAFGVASGAAIDVSTIDVGSLISKADAEDSNSVAELVRLSFKAEGTWQEVLHTLALLESLPYQVAITTVTFRAVSVQEEEFSRWHANFTLTVVKKK